MPEGEIVKKKVLVVFSSVVMGMTGSVFADHGQGNGQGNGRGGGVPIEMKVRRMSKKLSRMVQNQAGSMSRYQLKELKIALKVAIAVVKNNGGGGGFPPAPPHPPKPPFPPTGGYTCSTAPFDISSQTFKKIKQFAYSSSGLNKTSSGAMAYAEGWMQQYPCNYANSFIKKYKKVYQFAYSSNGLNKTSSGAQKFSLKNMDKLCENYPLKSEFRKYYQFAYSSSGLNMTSSRATEYAYNKVVPNAFSCYSNQL